MFADATNPLVWLPTTIVSTIWHPNASVIVTGYDPAFNPVSTFELGSAQDAVVVKATPLKGFGPSVKMMFLKTV